MRSRPDAGGPVARETGSSQERSGHIRNFLSNLTLLVEDVVGWKSTSQSLGVALWSNCLLEPSLDLDVLTWFNFRHGIVVPSLR